MKKIMIVTLFDNYNVGNRLQNYALQQVLLTRGTDVTVLNDRYDRVLGVKYTVKSYIKGVLGCLGFEKYKRDFLNYKRQKKIMKACSRFNQNNIKNIIKVTNKEAFEKGWSEYDIAFAGSDQVWHKWKLDDLELPFYYLGTQWSALPLNFY